MNGIGNERLKVAGDIFDILSRVSESICYQTAQIFYFIAPKLSAISKNRVAYQNYYAKLTLNIFISDFVYARIVALGQRMGCDSSRNLPSQLDCTNYDLVVVLYDKCVSLHLESDRS